MAQNKAVKATTDRPNIIFILADDLGYGDLSCYGSKTIKTPNIDKLAATGTRFNQSYAGSGISSPSRCALMTGKNTGHSRIRDNMCTAGGLTGLKINPNGDTTIVRRTSLQPQDTTIATVLHAAGYKTCLVNKWHLDAKEVTIMVHSEEDYNAAVEASNILFGNATSEALKKLDEATLLDVFNGVPQFEVSRDEIAGGVKLIDLCVEKANVFPSKGEMRKLIQSGGVSLNKEKVSDVDMTVD